VGKVRKSVYLVGLHCPLVRIERKMTEGLVANLFEISNVCLEGGAARFLFIQAMAEHATKCLSCQGILHCLTETGAILYIR
jgi:hypothetical protein